MKLRFIYRAPGVDDGGAGPTLEELENEDDNSQENSDDKDSLEDFDQDGEKSDDKDDDSDEDDKDTVKTGKDKADPKDKEEKTDDEDKDDSDSATDDEDPLDFYKEVNEARGVENLEVEYGDVDPLSPAGVAIRENAVYESGQADFEAYLEKTYPKAYAYFAHTAAGKSEEEFFGNASDLENLPTEAELLASTEVQKEMVVKDLIAKGNTEKHANAIVKLAIEDNELEEMAKQALTSREAAKQAKIDDVKKANDDAIERKTQAINKLGTVVDNVVATGKIGNINIPEKDRKPFAEALKKNVRYDNGKFMLVSELTDESLNELFGKEYFAYKKGDLGQLVEAAAKTQNARRLKATLPKDKTPNARAEKKNEISSLSDIDADD